MAATSPKKATREKVSTKTKTRASGSGRASAKPAGKAKKPVIVKKVEKKTPSAKKAVAIKKVAQKSGVGKKPRQKAKTTQDRLVDLRKSLLRKKETILKEVKEEIAKYISGENKQLVDTALDDGDWAVVDISEDINLQRLSAHRKLMYAIDEAIRKIVEGTYGTCEDCGEEISEKRLLVLPTATLCVDCQEYKEQFEAFAIESEE
jgi:DnaK suppressor protein